jgi:hypothetical protein
MHLRSRRLGTSPDRIHGGRAGLAPSNRGGVRSTRHQDAARGAEEREKREDDHGTHC